MNKIFVWFIFFVLLTGICFVAFHTIEASNPESTASVFSKFRSPESTNTSLNLSWTLLCGFLVFNMQAGFALLGAGFLQKKNTLNYLTMSLIDFCIGAIVYWAFGFALMFGGSYLSSGLDRGNAFIGLSGFFLAGNSNDPSTSAIWFFQMMFAAAAGTIIAGAVAERFKFNAHVCCSLFLCGILYPVYGHWVWGNGWLSNLPLGAGLKDFAGSGVIHGMGGLVAFIGAWMVGPRFGKYNPDGTSNMIHGHNLSYIVLGTLFLIFGWFGFNAGSTLAASDLRISLIATNTFLAAATGATTLIYYSYFTTTKADVVMACNGALAGCVAITASGAYVPHWAALVIGLIAGIILRASLYFMEFKLRIDDPIGAVSVHGANGLWGLLSVGIFADGSYMGVEGLIKGSGWQLLAQFIGCLTLTAWTFGVGYLMFLFLRKTIGLRVSIKEENSGLDLAEHGLSCYPDR